MNICWIADCRGGVAASVAASHRYRMTMPAKALREKGHTVEIVTVQDIRIGAAKVSGDVIVIGKLFLSPDAAEREAHASIMLSAAASGARTIADVCDDHFDKPTAAYWRELCGLVDACVAGSPAMATAIKPHTKSPIFTIGDPLGSPKGEPHVYRKGFFTRKPLKIAWYGAINNVTAMEKAAFAIMNRSPGVPIEFHLVTLRHKAVDTLCEVFCAQFGKRASMTFHEWSEATQWRVVENCDLVLIPSDPMDPLKAVKSANRLTDGINAGRYVIASPVPAYLPYSDVATVTTDIPQAVEEYAKDPNAAFTKIVAGQTKVERDCGNDSIAHQWLKAFSS